MTFFLVKSFDELVEGDVSGALSTLTSGASPTVKSLENDLGEAFTAFLGVFEPAEAKTILASLTTTLQNGVKAGVSTVESGTVTNAEAGAQAAASTLESAVSN